jgi:uncharacterized membrane protein YhhN
MGLIRDRLAFIVLAAAILGGVSYMISWTMDLSPAASLVWKGSGVALLAVYAALKARTTDGWLLCAVMAAGAAGDVLLAAAGTTVGAAAFLIGHLIAIGLYLRNRRPVTTLSQRLLAILLVPATVALAWLLPATRSDAPPMALYAVGLSAMAATAWTSRFPRRTVGVGALMFLVSDLLIFARSGPLAGNQMVGYAIWALYFAGQFRICVGVVHTLRQQP